MSFLQTGMQWLDAQRHRTMAVDVVYQRAGAIDTKPGKATPARFGGDTLLETELEIQSNARDFLFQRAFFEIDGVFNEPGHGDTITIQATGEVCQVANEGADKHWRWCDPYCTTLRVHSHTVSPGTP